MAVKTKLQIHTEINSLLADNISGNISANDVRTCLHDIVDSYFDAPYLEFQGSLTQTGTNNPVVITDKNTLGISVNIIRDSTGYYLWDNAIFLKSKTRVFYGAPAAFGSEIVADCVADGEIEIGTYNYTFPGGGIVNADDLLFNTPIIIRVYP